MPLQRRVPKRGFVNIHALPVEIVNVGNLNGFGGEPITSESLKARGLISSDTAKLKVLGNGELKEAVTVHAHKFSESARKKIEEAGGMAAEIVVPRRPKRLKKKSER